MIPEGWQNGTGVLAGATGLFLVPMLLRRLFRDKEPLAAILSIVAASALLFYVRIVLTQLFGGMLLVYAGVVLVNICTSGHRHERKDGRRDRRYNSENNPYFAGLFSGAMQPALIALGITFVYLVITGGDLGILGIIGGVFGGFFVGIYEIFFPFFKSILGK
jgi:hypothetical protein